MCPPTGSVMSVTRGARDAPTVALCLAGSASVGGVEGGPRIVSDSDSESEGYTSRLSGSGSGSGAARTRSSSKSSSPASSSMRGEGSSSEGSSGGSSLSGKRSRALRDEVV